jgi:cytochrome c oxidase subunit I+III
VVLVSILRWLWQSDPRPGVQLHDIGGGVCLPDHMTGSRSHAWWAMVVLMLVNGTVFASLAFGFFYLWTVSPGEWPPAEAAAVPASRSLVAVAAGVMALAAAFLANRSLRHGHGPGVDGSVLTGVISLWIGLVLTVLGLQAADISPQAHAYGAALYALVCWQGMHVILVTLMGGYTVVRRWRGLLDASHRATFDNTRLMWLYTAAQGLVVLAVMYSPALAS